MNQVCRQGLKLCFLTLLISPFTGCEKEELNNGTPPKEELNENPAPAEEKIFSLTDFTPKEAIPGTSVVISGTDFPHENENLEVWMILGEDRVKQTLSSKSATSLNFSTPADSKAGAYSIEVTDGNTSKKFSETLIVTIPEKLITESSSTSVTQGQSFIVYTSNIGRDETISVFMTEGETATEVAVTERGDDQFSVEVPENLAPGNYTINIIVGEKTVLSTFTITVTEQFKVLSVLPLEALPNQLLTIEMKGIQGLTMSDISVYFFKDNGSSYGEIVAVEGSSIQVKVKQSLEEGASYQLSVRANGKEVLSEESFTVATYEAPVISAVNPTAARVDQVITITGSNFGNIKESLYFSFIQDGSSSGYGSSIIQSITDTQLEIIVPFLMVSSAPYQIKISKTGKPSNSDIELTILGPAPVISAFSKSAVKIGEGMYLTGENFGSELNAAKVEFINSQNESVSGSLTRVRTTRIEFYVPTSLPDGSYKIKVTVSGQSVIADQELAVSIYTDRPVITSISPDSHTVTAGGTINLTGYQFIQDPNSPNGSIQVNLVPAPGNPSSMSYSYPAPVQNNESAQFTVPAEAQGPYEVIVSYTGLSASLRYSQILTVE